MLPSYRLYKILIITLGPHDQTHFSDMKAQDCFLQKPECPALVPFSSVAHGWALHIPIGWKEFSDWTLNTKEQRVPEGQPGG